MQSEVRYLQLDINKVAYYSPLSSKTDFSKGLFRPCVNWWNISVLRLIYIYWSADVSIQVRSYLWPLLLVEMTLCLSPKNAFHLGTLCCSLESWMSSYVSYCISQDKKHRRRITYIFPHWDRWERQRNRGTAYHGSLELSETKALKRCMVEWQNTYLKITRCIKCNSLKEYCDAIIGKDLDAVLIITSRCKPKLYLFS